MIFVIIFSYLLFYFLDANLIICKFWHTWWNNLCISYQLFNHQSLKISKQLPRRSTSFKASGYMFSTEVESILGVIFESFKSVAKSKTNMLGLLTLQVSFAPNLIFRSLFPKKATSSTNASEGGSNVAERIKKTLALL